MITLLVPPGAVAGRRERIDDPEQHHLRVRRAQDGERVGLRDGAGLVGTGRLVASGREWLVEVETTERRPRPIPLALAVAAGDRERFTWLVEKAVELGATTVVPLGTERTGGVATRLRESHLRRLRRHALEAIKQCGAAWTPDIEAPVALAEFVSRPDPGLRWLGDPAGDVPPASLHGEAVTVLIGPEGGLSEDERDALTASGYRPIILAPYTLRFETAALAAVAAVTTARLRGIHG